MGNPGHLLRELTDGVGQQLAFAIKQGLQQAASSSTIREEVTQNRWPGHPAVSDGR